MKRMIRTTIDHQGNVTTDFSGYVDGECLREEERLRRQLSELGLSLRIDSADRKQTEVDPSAREGTIVRG